MAAGRSPASWRVSTPPLCCRATSKSWAPTAVPWSGPLSNLLLYGGTGEQEPARRVEGGTDPQRAERGPVHRSATGGDGDDRGGPDLEVGRRTRITRGREAG